MWQLGNGCAGVEGGSCSRMQPSREGKPGLRMKMKMVCTYCTLNTYIEANVKEGSADLLQPQPPVEFEMTS